MKSTPNFARIGQFEASSGSNICTAAEDVKPGDCEDKARTNGRIKKDALQDSLRNFIVAAVSYGQSDLVPGIVGLTQCSSTCQSFKREKSKSH